MDRPFPWGLVVIGVMLGWGTLTLDDGWARYAGLAAVVVIGGALAYQITLRDRAMRAAQESAADDVVDPWDQNEPES